MVQASTIERLGGYRVVRRLARGDSSEVLLAIEDGPFGFQREVVLKVLLPRFVHDEQMRKLFTREAGAYGRLRDPGVVKLLDFSVLDDQLVMVLEYIDGESLGRVLATLRSLGRSLDPKTAIHIGERLFSALAAAHGAKDEKGQPAAMIHRNVSPSNVLLSWNGEVKLSDLGVAKIVGSTGESVAGLPKGTEGYLAPEQLGGDDLTVDTDVYCAALVLWELLSGKQAFPEGTQLRSLRAIGDTGLLENAARIEPLDKVRSDVDKRVTELLTRALEPKPADRNVGAGEIAETLRALVSPEEGRGLLATLMETIRAGGAAAIPPRKSAPSLDDPSVQFDEPPLSLPPSIPSEHRRVVAPPTPKPYKPTTLTGLAAVRPEHGSASKMLAVRITPQPMPAVKIEAKPLAGKPPQVPGRATPPPIPAVRPPNVKLPPRPAPSPAPKRVTMEKAPSNVPETAPSEVLPTRSSPSSFPAQEKQLVIDYVAMNRASIAASLSSVPPPPVETPDPIAAALTASTPEPALTASTPEAAPELRAAAPTKPELDANALAKSLDAQSAGEGHPSASPTNEIPAAASSRDAANAWFVAEGKSSGTGVALVTQSSVPPATDPRSERESDPKRPSSRFATFAKLALVAAAAFCIVRIATGGSGALEADRTRVANWAKGNPTSAIPTPTSVATTPPPNAASAMSRAAAPIASSTPSPVAPASESVVASPSADTSASAASPSADTSASAASPSADAPASAASPSADASPSAAGTAPEGMTWLRTPAALPGHRIFVDDKPVAQTPDSVLVRCGSHTVKLGSSGKPRSLDLPCAGELVIGDH